MSAALSLGFLTTYLRRFEDVYILYVSPAVFKKPTLKLKLRLEDNFFFFKI